MKIITIVLILYVSFNINKVYDMNKNNFFQFPTGGFYTYNDIERNLNYADIDTIVIGDSYTIVTQKLGEPNGEWGSGIVRPYYLLSNGDCVVLKFSYDINGNYDKLVSISIATYTGEWLNYR